MSSKATRKRKTEKCKHHQSSPEQDSNENRGEHVQEETNQGIKIPWNRMLMRFILIGGLIFVMHIFSNSDDLVAFAKRDETVPKRRHSLPCSKDYADDLKKFKDCAPKHCGRVVMDGLIKENEAERLLKVAKQGLALGGSNGGASILDLHSGALSKGNAFVDIYQLIESGSLDIFTKEDFDLYKKVASKVQLAIAGEFSIPANSLHLTKPTFFSRMNTKPAKTIHDEYWHPHVDKETYKTFDYTSLVYLSNYGNDFEGGRFVFIDKKSNSTIEPKLGRLSFFTSGSENQHYVEKVSKGTRYAMTISFTCDKKERIDYPKLRKKQ
ncbi:2-oxoglutarate and iron-dependent oxygenase domain-containing protein 3-like [Anneissia japonica]|uniref:2-oxoglutarate and iron-dependent oxygenase domain-containing protein 3-like n=1 Tax=Anneissia japonica TaxID=1529436 RepID=UPI001425AECC|nr:2-oxoglutarate and iron-dependent oxygenase domain-containing protein 3-like [Anneissia japonica]